MCRLTLNQVPKHDQIAGEKDGSPALVHVLKFGVADAAAIAAAAATAASAAAAAGSR